MEAGTMIRLGVYLVSLVLAALLAAAAFYIWHIISNEIY